jgi:hypothetical protein
VRRRRWGGKKVVAACLVALALFAIDVTIVPPARSRDITKVPTIVHELARYPVDETVAFYPLSPGRYFIPLQYRYFQMFHKHPMMNYIKPGTMGDIYQGVLKDLYAPYTPSMLKGLGIDKVVVINDFFKIMYPVGQEFDPAKMPAGYELVKKTKDGYIYDVTAAPATIYPLYYTNFTSPAILDDGQAWTVMIRPNAEILLVNKGGESTQDFSIFFKNYGKAGTLSVALDGVKIGESHLYEGPGEVRIAGLKMEGKRQVLSLRWNGKPVKMPGEAFGAQGEIDNYLMFSRPALKPSGI